MARGIEELAEMQVTGPVQGGDMVMKPDQAPTGAAALLNKMSRQNTPGIFKLPMPDKQMPGFMQVAAEGVEQQTAKGDSINQMAGELMRQGIDIRGMGMDEIIQIYEQTFGSPGDVDEFGVSKVDPSDWRTILKMIQAGMSPEQIDAEIAAAKFPGNFTEEKQNVVELPKNLKTGPDNPETELAYITDDEKALLALMNPGTPHEGPKGVPTYDEDPYDEQQVGQTYTSSYSGGSDPSGGRRQMAEDMASVGISGLGGGVTGDKKGREAEEKQREAGFTPTSDAVKAEGTGIVDIIKDAALDIKDVFTGEPLKTEEWLKTKEFGKIENLIDEWEKADVKLKGFGVGDIFTALMGGPYKKGSDKLLREDDTLTLEGLKKKIKELGGNEAIESLKHLRPELYYKFVDAGTVGAVEELSKTSVINTSDMDRKSDEFKRADALNRKIFEARETVQRGKEGRDRHPGTGRPVEEQITEEEEVVTSTTDPRAGQYNVGGTMPYTEDIRTAGVEMDVPLGRRFQIDKEGKYRGTTGMDLSEAMKYATLGGYSQLEPFQEYLARRRKHLGEDEPRYFDEEGNVIFSETT